MIKDEMQKRKVQDIPCLESADECPGIWKAHEQDQFHASLVAVLLTSHKVLEQSNAKARLPLNSVSEESVPRRLRRRAATHCELYIFHLTVFSAVPPTLRDGALQGELAPTLTIKDSLASPFAFHVFSHILLQLSSHVIAQKSQSQGIVIVALSRSPSSYAALLNMNGVDVASSNKWIHILDCYTDPLGWKDKTRKSVNATDCSPQISIATSSFKTVKDVDKLFSVITELGRAAGLVGENKARFCVAIDSLSELLRHASLQSVAGLLSDLRSHDQISNIFGLLHSDLHEERTVAVLEYMSSMVASVDPYHSADGQKGCLGDSFSQQNLTKGKFNVRSKRRNGRVRVTCEEFKVESGGISFASVSSVDGTAIAGLLPKMEMILLCYVHVTRSKNQSTNNLFEIRTQHSEIVSIRNDELDIKTEDGKSIWTINCKNKVQFNLQLSEKERVDRSNVVLPFEHQGNGKPIQIYDGRRSLEESNSEANPISSSKKEDSAMGEIIYFRDSDDEMPDSDEDPDDDLDI
ncbi:hypothetical protein V8G54_035935 [Vigna mungo]|uniref:Elongator complex protein 5 n=1 Tax=Vigna mungo TaxID=3915 RepID=A0AAQ3MFT9_VIGMU